MPPETPVKLATPMEKSPPVAIELAVETSPGPELQLEEPVTVEIAPLDLSIPQDILNESADTGFALNDEPGRLPNLFGRENRKGSKVSGKFLFEDEKRASLEGVNGAQINVEVPLE